MRETAEFAENAFDDVNDTKGVYARFYLFPHQNQLASAEAGRPVFEDKEFIEIIAAGNSSNVIRRKASDMDRQRFRAAYAKFKEGDNEQLVGLPLSEVPWITRSQIEELAYIKCRTCEQLATLNDQACGSMPGLYELKRKAEAWLKKSEDAAPFTALAKENDELRARVAALEEALKQPAVKKA